ncbi:MAG: endonuclease [Bacteroidota bacterium]
MKIFKKINLLLGFLAISFISFAQTSLPTSFDFNSATPPNGWTLNLNVVAGNTTYTTGSDGNPSCRLDGAGEYVQIFFADVPGPLTFYMKGTATSVPAFTGKFSLLESVDGTNWDTLTNYTTMNAAFTLYTISNINSASRYVRFYYTTKVSGSNVALDQVNLAPAPAGPVEINIKYNSTDVINNSEVVIGTTASSTFTLENNGSSGSLDIANTTLTGANASDFSFANIPASVAFGATANFTVNFNPTGADGTKKAILTIYNNDTDENPYIINLYGIKGQYATEPSSQPTNLNFTSVKSYSLTVGFSDASTAPDSYIVLKKINSAVTEIPVDGVSYTIGDYIGNAQVVYVGDAGTFKPSGIIANNIYHFSAFSFNGPHGFENYLTTTPLNGNTASSGNMMGTYYSSINSQSSTFIQDLHNLINPHTQIYYSNYAPTIISEFYARDTTNGQKVVTCVYSGFNSVYSEPFYWANSTVDGDLSREHTFCASWMPSNGDVNAIEYSDLYNIYPTEFDNANSKRSNNPLGVVANATSTYLGCKYGTDANGNTVFEPRNEHKGDAARAMFHMIMCYNGTGGAWKLPTNQNQDILKTWNTQDPVSNHEIARNDYVNSKQTNRNPFIDHPEWANLIDFYTVSLVGTEENNINNNVLVYPNPSNGIVNIVCDGMQIENIQVTDILGQIVLNKNNANSIELNKGLYFVHVFTNKGEAVKRVVIN